MGTRIGDPQQELLGFYSETSLLPREGRCLEAIQLCFDKVEPHSETQILRVTGIETTAVVRTSTSRRFPLGLE